MLLYLKFQTLCVIFFMCICVKAENEQKTNETISCATCSSNSKNPICTKKNEKFPGRNYFTYQRCLDKNGNLTLVTFCCPQGHYYDINKTRCLTVPGGGNIVYADYNGVCKDNHKGILIHPTQKQFYYICKDDAVLVAKCPNLRIYDPITNYCVDVEEECSITIYDESNGEITPPLCTNSGRFGIPGQPNYFYMCTRDGEKHYRSIYKCPIGTYYDASLQTCKQIFEITTVSSTTLGWYLESDPYPPCVKAGRFRSTKNCSLYYVCSAKTNGTFYQTRFSCPDGMLFSAGQLKCMPAAEVNCNEPSIEEHSKPKKDPDGQDFEVTYDETTDKSSEDYLIDDGEDSSTTENPKIGGSQDYEVAYDDDSPRNRTTPPEENVVDYVFGDREDSTPSNLNNSGSTVEDEGDYTDSYDYDVTENVLNGTSETNSTENPRTGSGLDYDVEYDDETPRNRTTTPEENLVDYVFGDGEDSTPSNLNNNASTVEDEGDYTDSYDYDVTEINVNGTSKTNTTENPKTGGGQDYEVAYDDETPRNRTTPEENVVDYLFGDGDDSTPSNLNNNASTVEDEGDYTDSYDYDVTENVVNGNSETNSTENPRTGGGQDYEVAYDDETPGNRTTTPEENLVDYVFGDGEDSTPSNLNNNASTIEDEGDYTDSYDYDITENILNGTSETNSTENPRTEGEQDYDVEYDDETPRNRTTTTEENFVDYVFGDGEDSTRSNLNSNGSSVENVDYTDSYDYDVTEMILNRTSDSNSTENPRTGGGQDYEVAYDDETPRNRTTPEENVVDYVFGDGDDSTPSNLNNNVSTVEDEGDYTDSYDYDVTENVVNGNSDTNSTENPRTGGGQDYEVAYDDETPRNRTTPEENLVDYVFGDGEDSTPSNLNNNGSTVEDVDYTDSYDYDVTEFNVNGTSETNSTENPRTEGGQDYDVAYDDETPGNRTIPPEENLVDYVFGDGEDSTPSNVNNNASTVEDEGDYTDSYDYDVTENILNGTSETNSTENPRTGDGQDYDVEYDDETPRNRTTPEENLVDYVFGDGEDSTPSNLNNNASTVEDEGDYTDSYDYDVTETSLNGTSETNSTENPRTGGGQDYDVEYDDETPRNRTTPEENLVDYVFGDGEDSTPSNLNNNASTVEDEGDYTDSYDYDVTEIILNGTSDSNSTENPRTEGGQDYDVTYDDETPGNRTIPPEENLVDYVFGDGEDSTPSNVNNNASTVEDEGDYTDSYDYDITENILNGTSETNSTENPRTGDGQDYDVEYDDETPRNRATTPEENLVDYVFGDGEDSTPSNMNNNASTVEDEGDYTDSYDYDVTETSLNGTSDTNSTENPRTKDGQDYDVEYDDETSRNRTTPEENLVDYVFGDGEDSTPSNLNNNASTVEDEGDYTDSYDYDVTEINVNGTSKTNTTENPKTGGGQDYDVAYDDVNSNNTKSSEENDIDYVLGEGENATLVNLDSVKSSGSPTTNPLDVDYTDSYDYDIANINESISDNDSTVSIDDYLDDTTDEDVQCTTDISVSERYGITCDKEGAFAVNNSCHMYYECAWNEDGVLTPKLLECPKCLRFNEQVGYCDLPQNVPRCIKMLSNLDSQCDAVGKFSIPGLCHQYKECILTEDGKYDIKLHVCPNGENFNNVTEQCDALTVCEMKPEPTCQTVGTFPNSESCTEFYQCIEMANSTNLAYKQFTCPPGLVYNENIGACDLPKNVPWCANIYK